MWQVDWRSHLWRTESSWDVSNSSAVSDQNSLYQIRPSGSSPRSSIMWSALKLKSYLLLDLLRIRSLSCITTLKDESRTVELCMWCSLSHKRRLWDVQQNAIFQKCLWWMWIFFSFLFSWRKPSKNVGWEGINLKADELDGASQLSCLTSALSTSSSLSSMISLS